MSQGGFSPKWAQVEINQLIKLYSEGNSVADCAVLLKRNYGGVKSTIQRIRKKTPELLSVRTVGKRYPSILAKPDETLTAFDRLYHGMIPCKHWLICKPWGRR